MSLDLREPLRWLHVRRRRHLVSEPRACVRTRCGADKLACARFLSDDSQEESSAGREKCAVFRYDKAMLHVYDPYIIRWGLRLRM